MSFNDFIGFFQNEQTDLEDMAVVYHKFFPHTGMKSQNDYPYSYDAFMIWYNDKIKNICEKKITTIYTDRLLQWDYEKYNRLCQKHFGDKGQYWDKRDPEKIQEFLSDWHNKPVILVANIQYVNISNGYPVWRLDFYTE